MTVILLVWLMFEKAVNLFHKSMDYAFSCQLNFNTAVNFCLHWKPPPQIWVAGGKHTSIEPDLLWPELQAAAFNKMVLEILLLYDMSKLKMCS
jgi:hypothetical protein